MTEAAILRADLPGDRARRRRHGAAHVRRLQRETDDNAQLGGWLAIVVLAVAAGMILAQPAETVTVFNGAFIVDAVRPLHEAADARRLRRAILLSLGYFARHRALNVRASGAHPAGLPSA